MSQKSCSQDRPSASTTRCLPVPRLQNTGPIQWAARLISPFSNAKDLIGWRAQDKQTVVSHIQTQATRPRGGRRRRAAEDVTHNFS